MDSLFNVFIADKLIFYPFAALVFYFLCLEAVHKTKIVFRR